jgi:hypothetical protein
MNHLNQRWCSSKEHMKSILSTLAVVTSGAVLAAAPAFQDVTSFGARGVGTTLTTSAIQQAVDAAAAQGGGKVVVPPGRFLTGPIFLKSHVQLELMPGAVLLGSTNIADYAAIDGRWEGVERKVYSSLFTGTGLEQVTICGRGIIDGQGAGWWEAHRKTVALRKAKGIQGREPENPPEAPLRWPRPRIINLYNCTNVLIRDLTLRNSPSWTVHPVYCENVTLDNISITNPADSPNTDAVDPDSCRDVRISNCRFDVGDDCIVIKSGYNEDGRRVGIPCEDVLVSGCTFVHGHGGVVIGSEMSGSVRNVVVVNCIFDGTERGLRVKTSLGRGGVVENVRASNLVMRNITDAAFSITAAYDREVKDGAGRAAAEAIPVLRHLHCRGITVANADKVADLSGLPESPLEDFSLRDVQVSSCRAGIRCANAKEVILQDIRLPVTPGPAISVQNVKGLELLGLAVPAASQSSPVVLFQNVTDALLRDCKVPDGSGTFLRSTGGTNEQIILGTNRLGPGIKEREP